MYAEDLWTSDKMPKADVDEQFLWVYICFIRIFFLPLHAHCVRVPARLGSLASDDALQYRIHALLPKEMEDEKKRYFVTFSYDGSRYHGWQVQPNGDSVQAQLQRALSLLLRSDISVTGAGRTDAGVHARMMVAHFDTEVAVDCQQLCYKLNKLLPSDIAVSRVVQVAATMHARFSATSRTYHYYLHTKKDPFLRHTSCEIHYPLDFAAMARAAELLKGYEDFGAFCKAHADVKTTLCRVTAAEWHQTSPTTWFFEITANRFLRNMVRAVVGTLIEVGRGRMTLDDFRRVVEGKKRTAAGESMPAHALFLEEVEY